MVNKPILHTRTAIHRHSLGGVTSRRCGIEPCECLLAVIMFYFYFYVVCMLYVLLLHHAKISK